MARKNMSVARVERLSTAKIGKTERHNERKNKSYGNINVVPERIPFNVVFKSTGGLTYNQYFDKMVSEGTVSTRGLKPDATLFNEMIIDVNTEYFEERGGYEYAKQFYEEAYRFCCKVYGEDKIVSAVMHADEINKAVTETLGRPVYHYHLHVVAVPTVEKEIRWSKRCKDEKLRGTVKEVIHQVSHSKKWKNTIPMLDDNGQPILNESGKQVFVKSYSILQDDLFDHMKAAGFSDFERGERGSTVGHLTSLEYQVQQDQARLDSIQASVEEQEQKLSGVKDELSETSEKLSETQVAYKDNMGIVKTISEIESMGKKGITGKYSVSKEDYQALVALAEEGVSSRGEVRRLNDRIGNYSRRVSSLYASIGHLEEKLEALTEKYNRLVELTKSYLEALQRFPEKVKDFFEKLFSFKQKKQEQEQPNIKFRHKNWDINAR